MDHRTKVLSLAVVIAGAGAAAWFLYLEEMVFGSDAPPVASAPTRKAAPAPKPVALAPVAATAPQAEAVKSAPAPEPKVTPAVLTQPAEAPKAIAPVETVAAPQSAEKPAKAEAPKAEEKPKPVARKPRPTPAAPAAAAAPKEVAIRETPAYTAARDSGPRFNDLTTAVLYRDPKTVQELLTLGKWADKPDSRGVTPLMDAAQLGDAESADMLLRAGADPNRPGPGGTTAMSIARERKDSGLTGLLGKHGGR